MPLADKLTPPPDGILPGDELLLIRPGANGMPAVPYGVPPSQLGNGSPAGQALPIAFVIPGKPTPGAVFNVVMAIPVTLPDNLAGTQGYAGAGASSVSGGGNGTFVLRKLAAADGAPSPLGVASFAPGASRATLSQQAGAALAAGDVLQLVTPANQDPALSDVCITVLANRA